MSGGHFNYMQYCIYDIAESVERYINGESIDECDVDDYVNDRWFDEDEKRYIREHCHTLPNEYGYSEETLAEFRKGLLLLRMAHVYAQRIDWLLCGDDGEDSFHERLKEDLSKLEKQ